MTSASNGWAVGSTNAINSGPLILHWNGASWTQQKLSGLTGGYLAAVAASSDRDAWAVGLLTKISGNSVSLKNLILHWNGKEWSKVACPSPGDVAGLVSVAVTKSGAAWAVGFRDTKGGLVDMILRWTGRKWAQAANPAPTISGLPAGAGSLAGVAASSDKNVWAVGRGATGFWTVAAHWNGSAWRRAPMPNIEGGVFAALAAAPHGEAWAVGAVEGNSNVKHSVLIMRWNGHSWRRVSSPNPPGAVLESATALPNGTAWAVGATAAQSKTFVLHWNGRSWRRVASPNPTVAGVSGDILDGVSAVSASDIWAVGYTGGGGGVILHWNGSRWQ